MFSLEVMLDNHFSYNFYPPVNDNFIRGFALKVIEELKEKPEEELEQYLNQPSIVKDMTIAGFMEEFHLWDFLEIDF